MAFPKLHKAMYAGEFFYITRDSPDNVWKVVCFMFVPQGLKSEGLYRISGFSDSVEEVKMAFDKGMSPLFYRFLSAHNMKTDIACLHLFAYDTQNISD